MTNEELLEKIAKLIASLKEDMATKEDVKRVQNYVESIDLKVELNNTRTARIETTVHKIDDGLVVMQPKINAIAKDHTERIKQIEKHLGLSKN